MEEEREFTGFGTCVTCGDTDLLLEDGRCAACWEMEVFFEEDVEDDGEGGEMVPA